MLVPFSLVGTVVGAWLLSVLSPLFAVRFFGLVGPRRYLSRMEVVEAGYRRSTVLGIRPDRIAIETAGPAGDQSWDVPAVSIRHIRVQRGSRGSTCLEIERDGETMSIMPARQ